MEFWGIEVKPGQTVKCDPGADKYLHLSQASLGEIKKGKGNAASVPLFVNIDGKKLIIGTLSSDKCSQFQCDLVFEKEFELSHSWKDGSVYCTGYKTVISEEVESEDFSDTDSELDGLEAVPIVNKDNGKATVKNEQSAKPNADAAPKAKAKPEEPVKPEEDEDDDDESDDEDEDSEEGSDEEMAAGEGDSDEEEEDESSEEEEKATPKKVESGKKRQAASDSKTPVPEKKAKLVTPAGKTGGQDGKKGGHTATPYPTKQTAKTPANDGKSKPQTPKSGGSFSCKACSKTFNSDVGLQSHTKAKHST